MSRLLERYKKEILAELEKELDIVNPMAVPRLEKIVINVGVGEAIQNAKALDAAKLEPDPDHGTGPGGFPAKKSISAFKLRKGLPIACFVTLRQRRMYEFFDRLVNIVLPRVRDFRGVSPKAFDGRGNYTLGLRDQLVSPRDRLHQGGTAPGMNITIVTTARTDAEAQALLKKLGMPFRETA